MSDELHPRLSPWQVFKAEQIPRALLVIAVIAVVSLGWRLLLGRPPVLWIATAMLCPPLLLNGFEIVHTKAALSWQPSGDPSWSFEGERFRRTVIIAVCKRLCEAIAFGLVFWTLLLMAVRAASGLVDRSAPVTHDALLIADAILVIAWARSGWTVSRYVAKFGGRWD
jgi:hypothetical protein